MDKIEKIRQEIKKQIKNPQEHCYGVSSINKLRELLDFIDTLESEKPMQDGLEEEIDKYREEHLFDMPAFQQVARHFYELGKNSK